MNDSKQKVASTKPAAQRRWLRRNWKKIPLYILLIILVAAGIFAGVMYVGAQRKINSKPYQIALDVVKNSKRVQDKLGTPVEHASWFPGGELNDASPERANAKFYFQVSGPKGSAQVNVEAHAVKADDWGIDVLQVDLDNGSSDKVSLKDEIKVVDDAPPFVPNATPDPKKEGVKPEEKPMNIEIDL
jgi:hypothetical protein